jgi:hypothetical protein
MQGVRDQAAILKAEGFEILGFEVPARVDGLDYGRRYDIVVRDNQSRIFGVEVKTSLSGGVFTFDSRQIEFDSYAVERGALTATTPTIRGVMYRGQCMGCGLNSINLNWRLTNRLIERGVYFEATKPPKPGG